MPAPRKRSVKAKFRREHPSHIERIIKTLTLQDKRHLEAATGFVVICPVCQSRHAVPRDVTALIMAIEAVELVYTQKKTNTGYSRTGLLGLPRTIRDSARPGTVLAWCPCGYEITQSDLAPLLARYLMTGQQQFLNGGRYGDK